MQANNCFLDLDLAGAGTAHQNCSEQMQNFKARGSVKAAECSGGGSRAAAGSEPDSAGAVPADCGLCLLSLLCSVFIGCSWIQPQAFSQQQPSPRCNDPVK